MASADHNALVRKEFTHQAQAYAANPLISDPARLSQLVRAVEPQPSARVLDVATGPGYVAMAFAETGCTVIGLDITDAPLAIAEEQRHARGLTNVRFQCGDAEHLPFDADAFDIVVSRLALHHCESPRRVLTEMTRVCRDQGTVAIDDLVTSEEPARAAYQDRFEHLRDPSHTHALSISELLSLFAACGLEVEQVHTDAQTQIVEQWLANAHTPDDRAEEVRTLIAEDEIRDLSGIRPFRGGETLCFRHRSAIIVGRKLTAT